MGLGTILSNSNKFLGGTDREGQCTTLGVTRVSLVYGPIGMF